MTHKKVLYCRYLQVSGHIIHADVCFNQTAADLFTAISSLIKFGSVEKAFYTPPPQPPAPTAAWNYPARAIVEDRDAEPAATIAMRAAQPKLQIRLWRAL